MLRPCAIALSVLVSSGCISQRYEAVIYGGANAHSADITSNVDAVLEFSSDEDVGALSAHA
jgi:hypothetical protein